MRSTKVVRRPRIARRRPKRGGSSFRGAPGLRRPRAAGRRLARRVHLGRARPAAGGAVAGLRRHLRHLRRRDERGGDGRRAVQGGPRRARAALEVSGERVSDAARISPLQRGPIEILTGNWTLDYSPVFVAVDLAARMFSPYDTQPRRVQSAAPRSWPRASISRASSMRRSSCSSPPPMCAPAAAASSATPTSRPTCCSPRPACRRCSRPWKSTASRTGMAATPATRR